MAVPEKAPTSDTGKVSAAASIKPYLPPLLVDELWRQPTRKAPWIESVSGSLVMADVSGFTAMTERLSQAGKEGAEWLTSIINQYFYRMLDIGRRYGGSNLRFGGDALLLFFDGEAHAARAVATAFAMQKATRQFNLFRVGQYRVQLKMTAGVHSGSFFSASAGEAGKRLVHLVLGPATNRVAQIQSAATAGELTISSETRALVPDLCLCETRGEAFVVRGLTRRVNGQTPDRDLSEPEVTDYLVPYLPPYWSNHLAKNGLMPQVEGEHRKVDIIFINLLGVDGLVEKEGPEALIGIVQNYISLVLVLCEKYGAFVLQTDIYSDGFKLIVILGAPVAHENDTANAFRLVAELNRSWHSRESKIYQRVGVNSGFVFAGDIGPVFRRQYTVMGDAVNLSARLMSAASSGQILVSKKTADLAGAGFSLRALEAIRVKGKKEPIQIYALEGESSELSVPASRAIGQLLGRDREMELFKKECAKALAGDSRVILVEGEAGIGKSRLIQAFREHLEIEQFTLMAGPCQSHTSSAPFGPWVTLLNSFFSLAAGDQDAQRNAKVINAVRQLSPEYLESAPLFNTLLRLSLPENDVVRSLDGQSRRRRLFEMVAAVFAAKSVSAPLGLILEDLHWADQTSLELLNFVAASLRRKRILFCLSYRPSENLDLTLPDEMTAKISLAELPEEFARQIVRNTLGSAEMSDSSARAILAKAKGNPLFLEEIALALRHSNRKGPISPSEPTSESGDVPELPDRLQGLIMARLDSLDESARELVRTASVIGGSFDFASLRAMLSQNWNDREIAESLNRLARQEIVVPGPDAPERSYGFRHNLTEEVAYGTLMFRRRRQLHQIYASYLEQTYRRTLETKFEALTHHYEAGGDRTKTRFYAFKAGDKARRVFAMTEAANYFRKGFDSTPENETGQWPLRSYFLELIGDCHETAGRHAEASRSFRASLQLWRRFGRRGSTPRCIPLDIDCAITTAGREALLGHKIGVCCERMSKYDLSLKWLRAAQEALPARHPLQAAKLFSSRSAALFRKGLCTESIQWGKKSLVLSRRSDDRGQLANAHTILASSYLVMGNFGLALRHRLEAVRIYDELGDIPGQAASHNNLGACYQALGDLENAIAHYRASVKASERLGNVIRISIARNNIGEILLLQGHLADAAECFRTVIAACAPRNDAPTPAGLAMLNLARVLRRQGDGEAALRQLEKGSELLSRAGAHGFLLEARFEQAELYSAQGRQELAEQICDRALREAQERGLKPLTARGLRARGQLKLDRGDVRGAEASLQESIDLACQLKADYELAASLILLADVWKNQDGGVKGRSSALLEKAAGLLRKIGAQSDLADVQRALGFSDIAPNPR
jgi:class 3 adenylate cyclase/tetratricopeptide (TPR) repeat protein